MAAIRREVRGRRSKPRSTVELRPGFVSTCKTRIEDIGPSLLSLTEDILPDPFGISQAGSESLQVTTSECRASANIISFLAIYSSSSRKVTYRLAIGDTSCRMNELILFVSNNIQMLLVSLANFYREAFSPEGLPLKCGRGNDSPNSRRTRTCRLEPAGSCKPRWRRRRDHEADRGRHGTTQHRVSGKDHRGI